MSHSLILSLLAESPHTEKELSETLDIPLSELRHMLGELRDAQLIEYDGERIWLSPSAMDKYGRVDFTKIPGLKDSVGAFWKNKKP